MQPQNPSCLSQSYPVEEQWRDFLLRKFDVYAANKYELLLKNLSDVDGKRALVVGSGSGEFAATLAKSGARVTAIDIDSTSIALTLETAQEFGVTIEAVVAKLEDYTCKKKFDLVVATDVIEHIADDLSALKQMHELCSEDGRLVLTVPALQSLFGMHDRDLGHYRRYNAKNLKSLVSPFFNIQFFRFFGFSLIPVVLIMSKWLQIPFPIAEVGNTQKKRSFLGLCIRFVFAFEKSFRFPAGTSLLLIGQKRNFSTTMP